MKLREDISKVLVVFPEEWRRSKKQYVRLVSKGSTRPIWLGRKCNFSPNGNKAKIEYGEDDIRKLESAPDFSILQIRSDSGAFKFEKKNGKWIQAFE
jgi:hypothetical protein